MTKLNIPQQLYNPESPSDLTIIKDLPASIRAKGAEIIDTITLLETKRVSQSIDEVLKVFPDVRSVFIQGNGKIPDGLYNKRGDSWIGIGNFNYLPTDTTGLKEGHRIVIENKTFELVFEEEYTIWVEKPHFFPSIFFDLFETLDVSSEQTLDNRGNGDPSIDLELSNILKRKEFYLPFIISSPSSKTKTKTPAFFEDSFTFTATFLNISREYFDGSETIISPTNDAVLLFVRDEFENVKIGLAYDKDYNLVFFDGTLKTVLSDSVNESENYQFSIVYNRGTLKIYKDDKVVHSVEKPIISSKNLLFSICNDMFFGQYANGGAVFGEFQVFKEALAPYELLWTKNKPRTWSFIEKDTYYDLSIAEKIKLKNFIGSIVSL